MLKKSLLAVIAVGVLAFGTVGIASVNATLLLRSGERVAGQLTDMTGPNFILTVSGSERRIPLGEVVVIDFAGDATSLPDSEVNAIQSGRNLITMRRGASVAGSMYAIRGASPLVISVHTDAGARDYKSSDIGRIYLSRPTAEVATTGTTATPTTGLLNQPAKPEGSITIPANQQWTPTGLMVTSGEILTFSAIGEIQLSTDNNDIAGIAGARSLRMAAGSPLPNALAGALVYRVGESQAYPLGDQTSLRMPASGQLFIGINDDVLGDNQGQFYVNITRQYNRR